MQVPKMDIKQLEESGVSVEIREDFAILKRPFNGKIKLRVFSDINGEVSNVIGDIEEKNVDKFIQYAEESLRRYEREKASQRGDCL